MTANALIAAQAAAAWMKDVGSMWRRVIWLSAPFHRSVHIHL
jgi:hypothetical protein